MQWKGKQSFVKQNIFVPKLVKKLIRFSLILLLFAMNVSCFERIVTAFILSYFAFLKLSFKHFFLNVMPWVIYNDIRIIYAEGYHLASLFIAIICYYYQLRLYQLDVYVNWLLKQKQLYMPNHKMINVLNEYIKILTEVNQFNKFASKLISVFLVLNASTIVFLVYNIIYVNLSKITEFGHQVGVFGMSSVIIIIVLNALRIPNQLQRNKRNLISLIYKKNLSIKTRIKVTETLSINNLTKILDLVAVID